MWEKDHTTSLTTTLYLTGIYMEDTISTLSEENNVSTSIGTPKIDIEYDAGKVI